MERSGTETPSAAELQKLAETQLAGGKNRTVVVQELMNRGMGQTEARQLVHGVFTRLQTKLDQEQLTGAALVPALIGGLIAAVIGGVAWAFIGLQTGKELGLLAWAIGGVCGFAVVTLAGGKKGLPLQVIAVAASALGILIGKYGFFQSVLQEEILKDPDGGPEAAAMFSLFSPDTMSLFVENLSAMMGTYDLLWFGLAILTAWSMTKPASEAAEEA